MHACKLPPVCCLGHLWVLAPRRCCYAAASAASLPVPFPTLLVLRLPGWTQAATLRGHPLYRLTATEVLADTSNGKWKASDHRCVMLCDWRGMV